MSKSSRFASALSAIALVSLAGCATSQSGAGAATVANKSKVGLGTRALVALNAGDYANAIQFAERAVEQTPGDATVRTVLANAYFGGGRFASAEAAYRDSLTLNSNQPQLVLRLALVQIAQGKRGDALALLAAAQQMLDRADLGLALALAGQPQDAVAVLEPAARAIGADSRLRQNLAFAHALAGDWNAARIIAAQDLSADLVDQRIQQWMSLAKPARASDQVAALTGITPAPVDPGQPVQLALNRPETRTASAAQPAPAPAPASAPVAVAAAAPQAAPIAQPAPVAELPPLPELQPVAALEPAPAAPEPEVAQPVVQALLPVASEPLAQLPTSFEAPQPVAAKLAVAKRPTRVSGKSSSVVQLGAYGSPQRVGMAWDELSRRFPSLNRYRPVSARFNSSKGVVYRLAVKGFASSGEAQDMCESLQAKGKNCFVRRVAGDSPVSFAAR